MQGIRIWIQLPGIENYRLQSANHVVFILILSEELMLPFSEILDWSLFSVRMRPSVLASLPFDLEIFSPARYRYSRI